ncbi:MAG: phosphoenolpyruvate--protein phosphotransferase [Nannocystaceae bacterium]
MSRDGDEPGRERPHRWKRSGIAASPGVAIGPAHVVDRRKVHVPHRSIDKADVDDEVHRFRKGLRDTQAQIEQIKARLPHGEHRQILKAQQLMLRDPDLSSRVERIVRDEQICAEWALARVADEIVATLRQADDEYFRERSSDITFLAERVLLTLRGEDPAQLEPPAGAVVVAHDLPPADTVEIARAEVVGMVTAVGGQTSHSAIVARSMEIPAVVGVEDVHLEVEDGDTVIVDAIHGVVIVRPRPDELTQWEHIRDRYEQFEDRVQREHGLPASASDGTHITLRANVALEAEIGSALFHGAEGVGLYRTEFMYMDRETPPSEEEHYRLAKKVLRRVAPYPVVFRTFDLGSDKPTRLLDFSERERNPAMGLRSLRLALREREMFLAQLRGLLRAAVHGPLRIMLPLVSGLSELRAALDAVAEARRQLEDSRMAYAQDVPVGTMIEMPSAAITADLLAPHVDFMSIGTNDLIQYTLAIDRDNDDVGYLYRPLHPAVLRLVRGVAEAGRAQGIGVSLCGEMAADPRYTWVLVGLGVRELSMHPSAIPVIKNIIRSSEIAEMEELAHGVLAAPDVDEAERMVLAVMRERFPEHLLHGGGQRLWVEREVAP